MNNKLYHKKLSERRWKHNLERRNHKYNGGYNKLPEYVSLNEKQNKKTNQKVFEAPKNFSLVENTEETLDFINDSLGSIENKQNKSILQDFSKISNITPDTILYMMSIIEDLQMNEVPFSIKGKYKNRKDEKSRILFEESGFLEHLNGKQEEIKNIQTDVLTIKVGEENQPTTAQEVVQYLRKWLDMERAETKPIYSILIECMTNTKNHAYKTKNKENQNTNNHKWYLMAYHTQNEVHFVFLDNGHGIPQTLRWYWKDLFSGTKWFDSKLIESALQGKILRSQTGEDKRGKGLPKIYKTSKLNYVEELIIIANKGFVNCKNDTTKELKVKFKGTLISWKIKKNNEVTEL